MRLYHRTTAGRAILVAGFHDDAGGYHGTTTWHEGGVWLSDRIHDANDGVEGDDVLMVDIPEDAIAEYEWVQEQGTREWYVCRRPVFPSTPQVTRDQTARTFTGLAAGRD